jgi:hypothetical protein
MTLTIALQRLRKLPIRLLQKRFPARVLDTEDAQCELQPLEALMTLDRGERLRQGLRGRHIRGEGFEHASAGL